MTRSMLKGLGLLAVLALGLPAWLEAQTGARRNLNLDFSSGPPRGYAFLLAVPPEKGRVHEVFVDVRPGDTHLPPDQWSWEVDQSNAQIKSAVTFKWYAQASCPDDLTLLQVSGPAGTLTKNPLANPIWGHFSTQSFTVDTIRNVCSDWAESPSCDPAEPGCQIYETFELTGGVAPSSMADRLRLKASCTSGALPTQDYAAKIRLRCNRVK